MLSSGSPPSDSQNLEVVLGTPHILKNPEANHLKDDIMLMIS